MARHPFSVSRVEVERFVEASGVVQGYLQKYEASDRKGCTNTRDQYAAVLCRFFKWLRVVKGWKVSPHELLNDQLRRMGSVDIRERRFHVSVVLEFTRDNPRFEDYSDSRKYHLFTTIRGFYEYNEVPLTKAKGKFGRRQKRKHHPKQTSLIEAKRIIGLLPQPERTICLIQLQSGMELGAVLYKFGYMWSYIKGQLEARKQRVKIEIDGRKGNGKWYFTYISRDAIQELKKWLQIRRTIVESVKKLHGSVDPAIAAGTPIFITGNGTTYGEQNFHRKYTYHLSKHGMWKPYEKVSHMFRKLFKTEASLPERGIGRHYVEFWLGHVDGISLVGAEYDRTPELYERVIEKEYQKLEPYINIYSSARITPGSDPLFNEVDQLCREGLREFVEQFVKGVKSHMSDRTKQQVV